MNKFVMNLIVFALLGAGACVERKAGHTTAAEEIEWPDSVLVKAGDQVIAQTFDTLRQSLLSAIQSNGFPGAINFCHEKAGSLTSGYSDSVRVRRTALKYRNQDNKPDSLEAEVFRAWNEELNAGQKLQGKLVRSKGKAHYFKPIFMQALCMNCHGTPEKNIQLPTLTAIRKHYPEDLAIDFQEGDLRGSWHLIFESKP